MRCPPTAAAKTFPLTLAPAEAVWLRSHLIGQAVVGRQCVSGPGPGPPLWMFRRSHKDPRMADRTTLPVTSGCAEHLIVGVLAEGP